MPARDAAPSATGGEPAPASRSRSRRRSAPPVPAAWARPAPTVARAAASSARRRSRSPRARATSTRVSGRIQDVTRRQGGFVVSSTVNSSQGGGGGTFELRIPTRNLDAAMAALSRLGKVRERAQRSQDITAAAVSARSRLKDARTERKSLLRQLGEAVTLTETEAIRARLKLVSREIEQARAGVRRVNNRAAFSTVSVTLVADRSAARARGRRGQLDAGRRRAGRAARARGHRRRRADRAGRRVAARPAGGAGRDRGGAGRAAAGASTRSTRSEPESPRPAAIAAGRGSRSVWYPCPMAARAEDDRLTAGAGARLRAARPAGAGRRRRRRDAAQLRRRRGHLPRGRRVRHVLRRPRRSRPRDPRARRRAPDHARDVRPGRHLRRARDVRRRAALGVRRGDRASSTCWRSSATTCAG